LTLCAEEAKLELDDASGARFLTVTFRGGSERAQWVYTVFGDGGVTIGRFRSTDLTTPMKRYSTTALGPEQRDLLDAVASARLHTYDDASIRQREDATGRARSLATDLGEAVVSLHLVRGASTGSGGRQVVEKTFTVPGRVVLATEFPEIEEYVALRRIFDILHELKGRAIEETLP